MSGPGGAWQRPAVAGPLLRREGGFTLVELVVVVGVLLVLVGSVVALLEAGMRAERGQEARSRALDELRGAMSRLTKEVRQALSVSTGSTVQRLEMTTLVEGVEHRVVWELVGDSLRRAVDGGPPVPVLSRVVGAGLFCYDPPACALPNPATAKPPIVRITLAVRPAVSSAPPVTMATDVHLRNTGAS